ncbi:MAG: protein GumC [Deltaproteobacteria bacterium]|nr:protein GumC [Deltaproteobacteria bacterium]
MESFDISKYLTMAIKRKWFIIITPLVAILIGLTYLLITPKVYEARTLILVQPQKVPDNFVRNIVSSTMEERVRTISEQVTSRTNLEQIIREYDLYSHSAEKSLLLEEKVEIARQAIQIEVVRQGQGGFSITFEGQDPIKVMNVTNALASNFISENLKIRESQALGTSTFLADELESVRNQLIEKEEELKRYRERYMGGLPEQLDTNLRILERLQTQQDQNKDNLREAENRRNEIQRQIAETRSASSGAVSRPEVQRAEADELNSMRNELAALQARYTENHPDVIRLKETIERLEKKRIEVVPQPTDLPQAPLVDNTVDQTLRGQLREVELEIERLQKEITEINSRMEWYQRKIEETPKREQELIGLNRDYENLQEQYNSLLGRKLEADMAVSMEMKQKGEQFRVVDPANIPARPIGPDMKKILLMAFALGLGLGGGLAYLLEFMDSSYKDPHEAEADLKLPVLINLPFRHTEVELKRMKWKSTLAYISVSAGFVVSAFGIVLTVKGLDKTMEYIRNVMGGM